MCQKLSFHFPLAGKHYLRQCSFWDDCFCSHMSQVVADLGTHLSVGAFVQSSRVLARIRTVSTPARCCAGVRLTLYFPVNTHIWLGIHTNEDGLKVLTKGWWWYIETWTDRGAAKSQSGAGFSEVRVLLHVVMTFQAFYCCLFICRHVKHRRVQWARCRGWADVNILTHPGSSQSV